jgi:hypothetical protein
VTERPAEIPFVEASGVERRPGAASRSEVVERSDSRKWVVLLLVGLLAGLLIGGGVFWLMGRPPESAPSVATVPAAPAAPGPSVAQTPAAPQAPAAPEPQGMPEDIRRYLGFLQGVEAQRKQYEGQLTNQMLAIMPNLLMPNFDENSQPPDQQMARQFDQMAQQYAQATLRFQAESQKIVVPLACRKLHAHYSTALSMNPRLITETSQRLSRGDYSGLLAMRSQVGRLIDENYRAADAELARICQEYRERKPFDIGNTGGGPSILLP